MRREGINPAFVEWAERRKNSTCPVGKCPSTAQTQALHFLPPGLAPQTVSLGLVTTTPFMGRVQALGAAHLAQVV